MMSKLPQKYNSDDSKKENGRIPEMSMTTLPSIPKEACQQSHTCKTKNYYQICSATLVETQKNSMQRPKNCYSEKKLYPYQMRKIQKYKLRDSTTFLQQRLIKSWQALYQQTHTPLMSLTYKVTNQPDI